MVQAFTPAVFWVPLAKWLHIVRPKFSYFKMKWEWTACVSLFWGTLWELEVSGVFGLGIFAVGV